MDSFFVVTEGEVTVCTATPGLMKRTGNQSEVLCTKRKGDVIWLPSVYTLAEQKALGNKNKHRRRKSLLKLMNRVMSGKRKRLYKVVDTTAFYSKEGGAVLKLTGERYEDFIKRWVGALMTSLQACGLGEEEEESSSS